MKLKFNIKIIFALFLATMLGCKTIDDSVDLQPTQLLSEDVAVSTVANFQSILLTAYERLMVLQEDVISTSDYGSDDVRVGNNSSNAGVQIYRFLFTSQEGDFGNIFFDAYSCINMTNIIINKLPTLNLVTASDITERQRIMGEAYAIRALAHFDLVRCFSRSYPLFGGGQLGVPYRTTPANALDQPKRNTVDECYAGIFSDLAAAETRVLQNFAATSPLIGALTPPSIIRKPAVHAIRARVHQYRAEWASAIAQANLAISLSPALATGAAYSAMWTGQGTGNGEVIFKSQSRQGGVALGRSGYFTEAGNGQVQFATTSDIRNSYTTGDARPALFFSVFTSIAVTDNIIQKHRGISADYGRVDIKVFRTSEMFLIRAEANANLGNTLLAQNDFNAVRTARISPYTDQNWVALSLTQTQQLLRIMDERRRELAFEGHRFMDARRLGLGINRLDTRIADGIYANILTTNAAQALRLQVYPIPQLEVFNNPNMTQTSGY